MNGEVSSNARLVPRSSVDRDSSSSRFMVIDGKTYRRKVSQNALTKFIL
jgi:hypothetical protein